jgi:antitoxin component of MazEF toxin-antitoxin module
MDLERSPDRKLSRVGGSVVVAIPKQVRRSLNIGVGDRLSMKAVEGKYIVMEVKERIRGENLNLQDKNTR